MFDRWEFGERESIGGDDRFHILAVVEGTVTVAGDPVESPLSLGETMLLPAAAGATQLLPQTSRVVLLDIFLPVG